MKKRKKTKNYNRNKNVWTAEKWKKEISSEYRLR